MTAKRSPGFLDWTSCRVGARAARCVTCRGWALMRNPEGQPQHKVCAERLLAQAVRISDDEGMLDA